MQSFDSIPFDHLPWRTGVYQIENVITHELYVGGTVDIYDRCKEHAVALRLGTHESPAIAASYEKYGASAFRFSVIARTNERCLRSAERYWIGRLNPVFNINSRLSRETASARGSGAKITTTGIRVRDLRWVKAQSRLRGITNVAILSALIDAWKATAAQRQRKANREMVAA